MSSRDEIEAEKISVASMRAMAASSLSLALLDLQRDVEKRRASKVSREGKHYDVAGREARLARASALRWIFAIGPQSKWTFEACCYLCDFEPDNLRKKYKEFTTDEELEDLRSLQKAFDASARRKK